MELSRANQLKIKRLKLGWTQSTLLHFCRRMGMRCSIAKISLWENSHKKIPDRDWEMIKYIFSGKEK